jgi:Icc-related predicted phosphoesterase
VGFFRRGRPGNERWTRLFFTTDLHGSDDCFRKLITAVTMYKADVVVIGGDICGKMVVPIVRQPDGSYRATFLERDRVLAGEDEVENLERLITRSGLYPYRTEASEMEELARSPERVDDLTKELVLERVERWVQLAEEKLAGIDVHLFVSAGNDDYYEVDEILERSSLVVNHNGKVVAVDDEHEMIGLGYANETPWHCPRDISEVELASKIEDLVRQLRSVDTSIFCLHVPPVDSQLDTCPRLDASEFPPRIVTDPSGRPVLHGAGSTAVREAIERYQPLLGLHGHIHESRGIVNIGKTLAVNPGSEYSEGILRGVIVNLTSDGILSYQFTSG